MLACHRFPKVRRKAFVPIKGGGGLCGVHGPRSGSGGAVMRVRPLLGTDPTEDSVVSAGLRSAGSRATIVTETQVLTA